MDSDPLITQIRMPILLITMQRDRSHFFYSRFFIWNWFTNHFLFYGSGVMALGFGSFFCLGANSSLDPAKSIGAVACQTLRFGMELRMVRI